MPKSLRYDLIGSVTAELFDSYMEYKRLLRRLQEVLRNKDQYQVQTTMDAIPLEIPVLVSVRTALRDEQSKTVEAVSSKSPPASQDT